MTAKNDKYLILGSQGQLGREFQEVLAKRRMSFVAPAEVDCNITDETQINQIIQNTHPDIVVNCAAYNNVDKAEEEKDMAFRINADAVANLASICRRQNIFLVHFSSDYVFDGTKGDYYQENDAPDPLNVYGASKRKGEDHIQQILPDHSLIFRLSWVFGLGQQNFLYKLSTWVKGVTSLKVSSDEISVPTYTADVVEAVLLAIAKRLCGLYHLTNTNKCSRYEWAKYYLEKRQTSVELIPVSITTFPSTAKRPLCSAMSNKKLADELNIVLPTWQNAVDRFIERTNALKT